MQITTVAEIFGLWVLSLAIGGAGLSGIRIVFASGWRKSVGYALISGVFFTPTLLIGHGFVIIPAITAVFIPFPAGIWDTGLMFEALRTIAIAAVLVFAIHVSVAGFVSSNVAESQPTALSVRTEVRWLLLLVGVLVCAVTAEWAFRLHWQINKASTGPFSITVDTGSPALSDVAVLFQCSNRFGPVFMGRKKLLSSGIATFPAQYTGPARGPMQCQLFVMHPELPRSHLVEFTVDAKPREHVILQASVPRWSKAVMLKDPAGATPESDFYRDTNELTIEWVPYICRSDLERAKRLYIPLLVKRRKDVVAGQPSSVPSDEDYATLLAKSWDSRCGSPASLPPGLP